jgi:small Trp-rich protein
MVFVLLGVALVIMKLLDFGPAAVWPWWWVLSPFAGAVIWWAWADMSGYTKRREMDKMEDRKTARRRKALSALGLDYRAFDKQKKTAEKFKASRQREIDKVEGKRAAARQKARDSVLHSRLDSGMSSQLGDSTQQPDTKQ